MQRSDVQSKLLRSPLESVPLCCNFALSGLLYTLNRNYWHFACERCCVRYFLPPELIKTLKCSNYPGIWFLLFLNYVSDILFNLWSITVFFFAKSSSTNAFSKFSHTLHVYYRKLTHLTVVGKIC